MGRLWKLKRSIVEPDGIFMRGSLGGVRVPQTVAELANAAGMSQASLSGGSMWEFNESSGDSTDLINSNDLSPINTPNQGVGWGPLGGLTVQFDDADTAAMQASASTVFDIDGAGSFLLFILYSMTGGLPAAARNLLSKSAGGAGYEVFIDVSGVVQCTISDGTDSTSVFGFNKLNQGQPMLAAVGFNRGTTTLRVITSAGDDDSAATGGPPAVDSLANAASFQIGAGNKTAAETHIRWAYFIAGTGGGLSTPNYVNNLAAWMGI